MKIVNDPRKHELFRILKNLAFLANKEDFKSYNDLKKIYDKLLRDIFRNFKQGDEGFEWDKARNALDALVMMKSFYDELGYKEKKRTQIAEALKRIKKVERYLS